MTMPLFFLSISTPIGGITLDRFFLFSSFFLMILLSINTPVKRNLISLTLFVFIMYVAINRLFSGSELTPKFLLLITSVLSFYVTFKASLTGVDLRIAINISFIILMAISIFSLWHFFTSGYVPSRFAFLESMPFLRPISYEHMAAVNQSYAFPRISLPYPTPPQLSIVMAAYSLYFLSLVFKQKGKIYLIFLGAGIIIMMTTISRSGIIPFFLVGLLFYSLYIRKNIFIKYFRIILAFVVVVMFTKVLNQDLYNILNSRFLESSAEEFTSGHLGARMVAVNIFVEGSILQMIFGVGIGNYFDLHAHMSLLTLLVETGFIGAILFASIFAQRFFSTFKLYLRHKRYAIDNLIELMMVMLVFLGMLLYEFTYVFPLYMFLGLTCGNSILEGRILKQTK